MNKLSSGLISAAAGLILGVGMSNAAFADAQPFTFDFSAFGGPANVTGTTMTPFGSALINVATGMSGTSFSASSIVEIRGFGAPSGPVNDGGILTNYSVYIALNNIAGDLTNLASNSATFTLTNVDYSIFAVAGGTSINPTNNGTTVPSINLSGTTGTPVLLGDGTLVAGTAILTTSGGGPSFNADLTFNVCTGNGMSTGGADANCTSNEQSVFVAPVPFYNLAIAGLNTSDISDPNNIVADIAAGTIPPGGLNGKVGLDQEGGSVQFVPEPASLLLLGTALVGLGIGARRRARNLG